MSNPTIEETTPAAPTPLSNEELQALLYCVDIAIRSEGLKFAAQGVNLAGRLHQLKTE